MQTRSQKARRMKFTEDCMDETKWNQEKVQWAEIAGSPIGHGDWRATSVNCLTDGGTGLAISD
jgi:hypothetical protein